MIHVNRMTFHISLNDMKKKFANHDVSVRRITEILFLKLNMSEIKPSTYIIKKTSPM